MRKLSTLFFSIIFLFSATYAQQGLQLEPDNRLAVTQETSKKKKPRKGNLSQAKQISTEFIALSGYGEGGTTVEIPFRLILDNEDDEYGDSLSMTFPEGFTVLGVSNDDFFDNFDTNGDAEAFNGIDGQTISWGDNDNSYGGIACRSFYLAQEIFSGPYSHFTVTVSIDESVTGPQTIDFHISGDGFGPEPGDFDGTITMDEGLSVAGIVCSSEDHNTLQTVVYEVGIMYGLGPATPELTIFAPTDDAFEALPDGLLEELLADPNGALRNVLLYHGTSPVYLTENMFDGQEIFSGIVDPVTISFDGENIFVNDALIIVEDVLATNGVVHVIDAVLIPEDPVTPIKLPLDFQLPSASYNFFGFEGAFSQIQPNPDPNGENMSTIVMQTIKTNGSAFIAGTVIFLDEPIDFSSSTTVHLSSWSPKDNIPVRLKIESDNSGNIELDVNTTVQNAWETLTYDFSGLVDPDAEYVRVVVFFEFINGLPGDGSVYYFDNVMVEDPLSLDEYSSISEFNLYPNPTNHEFAIELNLMENSKLNIDVINVIGQNVKSFDLGLRSAGFNREVLDVNDLPDGVYILNITAGNEQVSAKLQISR